MSTKADLQEHFRQLCLHVPGRLRDGECPRLGAVSRYGPHRSLVLFFWTFSAFSGLLTTGEG